MLLIYNLMALLLWAIALWLSSLRSKNVNIVDVGWGLGFVLVAWLTWYQQRFFLQAEMTQSTAAPSNPNVTYAWILVAMVTLWGLRLSGYLAWRNWGKAEDYRYAAMRSYWGNRFPLRSLVTVFGFQAVLLWFISLCVQVGISGLAVPQFQLFVGLAVWSIGLVFETVGDWQLMRFKGNADNKGKVMNKGLWRWTRHPNYFGDFLVWWGIYLAAAQPSSWWATVSGPALMSFLLIRVSGVKLLEASLKNRVEGYDQYVKRTSSFFPWFPKQLKEK